MTAPHLCTVLQIEYPEGPLADEAEADVQAKLPPLLGLDEAQSQADRLRIYAQAIEEQRESFASLYGDPFGWEKRSEPRPNIHTPPVTSIRRVARAR